MVEVWDAIRLDRQLTSGRTKPVVLECEALVAESIASENIDAIEQKIEKRLMVVKGMGPPEVTKNGLCCEIFGNLLARELGIFTGEPAIVNIGQTLAHAMRPLLHPACLEPGLAVGTEYFRTGLSSIVPYSTYLPDELVEIARIYAFDLIMQNADRRKTNHNCAIYGKRVFAYDFDMTFSFLELIGTPPEPWKLSDQGIHSDHVFREVLYRQNINWSPFVDDVSRITEARLLSIADKVPKEWQSPLPKICKHILLMVEHASELALELQRSIS